MYVETCAAIPTFYDQKFGELSFRQCLVHVIGFDVANKKFPTVAKENSGLCVCLAIMSLFLP